MGVTKCCVPGCETISDSGILFHCFPRTPYRLSLWLTQINCKYLNSLDKNQLFNKRICAKHFERKFYENDRLVSLIARPTLFTEAEICSGIPINEQSDELYNVCKIPNCLKDHTYYNTFDSVSSKRNESSSENRRTDETSSLVTTTTPNGPSCKIQRVDEKSNLVTIIAPVERPCKKRGIGEKSNLVTIIAPVERPCKKRGIGEKSNLVTIIAPVKRPCKKRGIGEKSNLVTIIAPVKRPCKKRGIGEKSNLVTIIAPVERPCKKQRIDENIKLEEIEEIIQSDDTKNSECESDSDVPRQTQLNEELWVVRRQLCRGCHSDGAFWSLETTTEGVAYGDLLQTYCNIQLCPVSRDEHALSAICALCAARLREAHAFSAQARAAEEHFTSLYKQNRVRALVNVVKEDFDVREKVNEDDDLEISDVDVPDTANSNVVDDLDISFDDVPDTANSDVAPAKNITNEYTQKILGEGDPQASKEILTRARCDKTAPNKFIFHLSPSDYQRVGESFKCTRCNKIFCYRAGIHNHVKNVHLQLPEYTLTCLRCDKTFNKLSDFNRHKKHDHSIITKKSRKVYAISPSDFERVGDAYKCNRCEKQYKNFLSVRKHVIHLHLKRPRYTCSHCDKRFLYRAPFTQHKLEEHSIDDRKKCNACEATFNTNNQLDVHRNTFHMLGMQQTCPSPDCDFFCYTETAMKRHVIKHSNVRKYHCKYCMKAFLRKTNLTVHERIHTGDKRHVCNECGRAFVQRSSLKYHMRKHHPAVRF